MDSTQVGVLKQSDQVGFTSLLQSTNSSALEAQICFEVLSDFTNQTLKRKFANQQLSGLLVTPDFTESHGTRPVTVRLLHPSGRGRALPRRLGGQLLPGSLPAGGFTGCLLGTGHLTDNGRVLNLPRYWREHRWLLLRAATHN